MVCFTVSDVVDSMKYGNTTFMGFLQKCNKIIKVYHLKQCLAHRKCWVNVSWCGGGGDGYTAYT